MRELCDRFFRAVTVCTGAGRVKDRLVIAWIDHLDSLDPETLPSSAREDYRLLREALYAERPLGLEHPARASARKMSAQEAASCTELIGVIYRELALVTARSAKQTETESRNSEQAMAFELVDTHLLN